MTVLNMVDSVLNLIGVSDSRLIVLVFLDDIVVDSEDILDR